MTIQPLTRVYAYRDVDFMLGVETRWSPRVVECSLDRDTIEPRSKYVVKYRRESAGDGELRARSAAMCISEVIAALVFQTIGFPTPEPVLVYVSTDFAKSYGDKLGYMVLEGYHFGSSYMDNVSPNIPEQSATYLEDPSQLIKLWVIDCWLVNRDRTTFGNVLFTPKKGKKWEVVAIDHSDCFGGTARIIGEKYLDTLKAPSSVKYPVKFFEQVICGDGGCQALKDTIRSVTDIKNSVRQILDVIPGQWWDESRIEQSDMENCLLTRAECLDQCCDVKKWEELDNAISGGVQIPLL